MNPCEDKVLLINALVDGELDAANAIAIEQHLKTCPGCSSAFADAQGVWSALSAPGVSYTAPEAFRRRLNIALAAQAKRAAPVRRNLGVNFGSWWGWASGGGALAAAFAGAVLFVAVHSAQTTLADELVSDHVRSMLADHLMDVPTSDRHTVKPWFDGKVNFAPSVIDFADKGFPLAGGRLDYVRGQRAAAIIYRRRLHVINVFVWPGKDGDPFAADQSRNGYNLMHWSVGGLNYWAVSDLDPVELRSFRDLYRAALKA